MVTMANSRSKRLQPVSRLAKDKEKKDSQSLAAARGELESQQKKLDELLSYKEEYLIDFNRRAQRGVSGAQISQYRQFIVRLDDAIDHQQKLVIQCKTKVQQSVQVWQESRGRAQALENVIDKAENEERKQQDKKEQRQADELAQRNFQNRQ